MVLVGLLARVAYIVVARCYRFDLQYWSGFEMALIGRYLVAGRGFILQADSGPSAWTAPVYPLVVALAFRLFGVFSHAAAFALLAFNSIFAAFTSWTIYRISGRLCNETVALWSGWVWALLPSSFYFSVFWIWETTLSAFLLSALFLLTLVLEERSRLSYWCGYGVLWGIAGLTNPSLLVWLPFAAGWIVVHYNRRRQPLVLAVIVSALVFCLTLSPWLVRNYFAFGNPLLLRGGFGINLRAGNNPAAQGWWVTDYTCNNPSFLEQYKRFGESEFVAYEGHMARQWIAEHPRRFTVLTLRRIVFFWAGIPHQGAGEGKNAVFVLFSLLSLLGLALAIKRGMPGAFLFISLLLVYPLVYYITFPQPRYRHVIEPEMLTLAVLCVWAAVAHFRHQPSDLQSTLAKAARA